MAELKPCPFCGSDSVRMMMCLTTDRFYVTCKTCFAETQEGTVEQAAAAWNTRAPCPECDRQRERANALDSESENWHAKAVHYMAQSDVLAIELERQRVRANEAVSRVDALQAAVDQRYRIHAELETALGVIHLDSDQQMEAALKRVAALEAVAEAARKHRVAREATIGAISTGLLDADYALDAALAALEHKEETR